jgi:hypothetical protein
MVKADMLAAGVLLITTSVGLVSLQIPPVNRKQGPAVLTNKTQENFEQKQADNLVKLSGVTVCIHRKKI